MGVLVKQQIASAIGGEMIKVKNNIQINHRIRENESVGDFLHKTQDEASKIRIKKEKELIFDQKQIQPASLDLTLGDTIYHIPFTFLDYRRKVQDIIEKYSDIKFDISNNNKALLHKNQTYIVPLNEELDLNHDIYARCNPKSSTGRIDLFVRTITDKGLEFDTIPAGYKGKLYLIIIPQSFDVMVTEGISLNQIRFCKEKLDENIVQDRMIEQISRKMGIAYEGEELAVGEKHFSKKDGSIRLGINLKGINGLKTIGFKTKKDIIDSMDLTKINNYDPEDFFDPIFEEQIKEKPLVLNQGEFYLLASDLKIGIPPQYCAELESYNEGYGEHRSHYAGFFDPGFGWAIDENGNRSIKGSYVVYEVRINGPSVAVFHDKNGNSQSKFVKLHFYKNSQIPEILYGSNMNSNYQNQGLKLSKYFKKNWEEKYK
jgi:dCTP deaminase